MTLLILGGTGEARQIAEALVGNDAVVSLAGATRAPAKMPLPTRMGGFGGDAGFRQFLNEQQISAVLDATHPYAHRTTERTARICRELDLPYLHYLRPPWMPADGDRWTEIAREDDAAAHVRKGSTVFLGTGRQTLERFANLAGCRVICRQIDPPDRPFPFEGGEYLIGRPPFSVADETMLFRQLGVDWLIVKNAGGAASGTKLTAARDLGIPVLMIARPQQGDWPVVDSVTAALNWVAAL